MFSICHKGEKQNCFLKNTVSIILIKTEMKSSYLSCENYLKQVGVDLENCVYLWKFLATSLGGLEINRQIQTCKDYIIMRKQET